MTYILNILCITKINIKEIKEFIFENYYIRIRFTEEISHYSMKQLINLI